AAHGVADLATVDCFAVGSAIAVADASRTMRVRCAERRGARSVAARVLEGIDVLVDVDAARVLQARDAGPRRAPTRWPTWMRPRSAPIARRYRGTRPRCRRSTASRSMAGGCTGAGGASTCGWIRAWAWCCPR